MPETRVLQDDISARSQELRDLLAARLSLKHGSLEERLRRAGRRLPARIRAQGQIVAEAEALSAHPKLARRIDASAVARAHAEVRDHLKAIDAAYLRRGAFLGVLGGLAFNALLFAALLLAFLRWQGMI